MQPRIGSLFSGYGGLDLAVEQFYNAETAWHCQYDPEDPHQYAAAILAKHWPDVPNLGDITQVSWDQAEPVDILTGGFPCTDVSLAGQRAGLNSETRSGLWTHMARAIAALQPQLVVIENVRGLLSAPAAHPDGDVEPCAWCVGDTDGEPVLRALGAVLADLAQLGFDAEWVGLPASDIGAPHERFRVFILAWPADSEGPRLEDRGEGRPARLGAADEDPDQPAGGERRLPASGQAESGRARADARGRGGAPSSDSEGDGRVEGRAEPARLGGRPDPSVGGTPDWGVFEPAVRRWEALTGRPAPGPVDDRGRLSPALPEWMMGLPEGWLTVDPAPPGMSPAKIRNAQLKAAGNGVVPQQAYAALADLWHRATTQTTASAA